MKLADIVNRIVIDPRKLIDYALDPNNPVDRHKALIFERHLGFTRQNYESLMQQIESKALAANAHLKRIDKHGRHYFVDLEIIGTQGQRAVVRTGWLVAPDSDEARLVTLYVRRRL